MQFPNEAEYRAFFKHAQLNPCYREYLNRVTDTDYYHMASAANNVVRSALRKTWEKVTIRPALSFDFRLMLSAQLRASVAGISKDPSGTLCGTTPTEIVRLAGFYLPESSYPTDSNHVETILMASRHVEIDDVLGALTSPHCPVDGSIAHMNGFGFYLTQVVCGIGLWVHEDGEYTWCFHSAHPERIWDFVELVPISHEGE